MDVDGFKDIQKVLPGVADDFVWEHRLSQLLPFVLLGKMGSCLVKQRLTFSLVHMWTVFVETEAASYG